MRSRSAPRRASVACVTLLLAATLSSALLPARSMAQVAQTATPERGSAPVVHYVVLWRTELLASPDTAASVLATLDSGAVIRPDGAELFQTGHARVTVNGRRGWVDNGYIKRIVTMRSTDTVKTVTRRPAPRRPVGDPRDPDRVLPRKP